MKILVTGGSGYIGKELCKKLNAESYDIKNSVEENILHKNFLEKRIKDKDIVYHLAGPVIVNESFEKPFHYWRNIYEGTKNVVEACLKYKTRIVFISTQLADDKFRCNCCGRLNSPYADAKYEAEKVVSNNLKNYAIIRLVNVFDYKDKDPYRNRLIPRLIDSAIKYGVVKIYPPKTDKVELITLDETVKQLSGYKTEGIGIFRLHGNIRTIGDIAEEIAKKYKAKLLVTEEVRR